MNDFETWWYNEGSQGPNGMDLEEHCKRINSWAVPNVRWIGKRIQEALNAPT
jgi:hypothetical protein